MTNIEPPATQQSKQEQALLVSSAMTCVLNFPILKISIEMIALSEIQRTRRYI